MPEEEAFLAAVMAAARVFVAIAGAVLEQSPVDITLVQYRALVALAVNGPMCMSDVAAALQLSPSSTTRLVERLERKDLVLRRTSPASRRSVELALRPQGEELVDLLTQERRRRIRELVSAASEGQRDAMRQAFEQFAELAGEPIEASPALGNTAAAMA